ncbi:MAG: V-type ATPase subunit [Clostridia bacterium]|nr:V-type ATPase subunit [Clostridia bacterium]
MAESLINSIARLRVIEKRLLTKEFVSRLVQAPTYEDALKLAREAGFGAAYAGGSGDELEGLVSAHLDETYSLVGELMPERLAFVTGLFRMRHDLTNIKLLYKLRLLGSDPSAAELAPGGVFSGDELKTAVKKGDYSILPRPLADTLEELDVKTYKNPDARLVSGALDSAYIGLGLASGNAFAREYFGALADFTNLIAAVRGMLPDMLLPCGEYKKDALIAVASLIKDSPESVPALLKTPFDESPLKAAAREGFEEYLKTGSAVSLEKARDEYLIGLAARGKSDIDSPAPIVGFMLAREREAEVVRLVLTVKRSGLPVSVIEERSVMLYG